MKKLLITGANGLLGQKLVGLLAGNPDYQVIATGKGACRLKLPGNMSYRELDITDEAQVRDLMEAERPDAIINTAAMTNVDKCESEREACDLLNVEAVRHLAKSAKEHDSFLLHLSTDFIFDGENGPYDEKAASAPLSHYGESKLRSEELLADIGGRYAIVRTVLVYGIVEDMSRSNIILWVKESLENGKALQLVNDQWRTPTLAEDLAVGCFLIVGKEAEGIFNIAGKDMLNPYQMAVQTAEFFDLDKSLITETDGSKFKQAAKRPPKTGLDIGKAERELGYRPRSFKEGIALLAKQLAG